MRALHKDLHLQPYLNKNNNNKPEFLHLLQQCCHQVKDEWEKSKPHTGCGLGCDNDEELSTEFMIVKKFKSTAKIFNFAIQSINIFSYHCISSVGTSNFSSHSWMTSGLGQWLIDRKGGEGPTQECRLLPCDLYHHHHHHHRWL